MSDPEAGPADEVGGALTAASWGADWLTAKADAITRDARAQLLVRGKSAWVFYWRCRAGGRCAEDGI
jgi:hypothetical protein